MVNVYFGKQWSYTTLYVLENMKYKLLVKLVKYE